MTAEEIRIRAKREATKHEAAAKIRELLDSAKSELKGEDFDPEEFEGEVLELVNEP